MIPPEVIGRLLRLEEQYRVQDEWNREQDRRLKRMEGQAGGGGGGGGGDRGIVRVRTNGTVTAKSGTAPNVTPGSGVGVLVDWDGTNPYTDGATITLWNSTKCVFVTGNYGWARKFAGVNYEIVSMDF